MIEDHSTDTTHAITVAMTGGPDVLEWAPIEIAEPGPGQLVVKVAAAGVNFIDVYHRSGFYELDLPFTPGLEGAGIVEAVGAGVSLEVGAPVAWAGSPGSYAERVIVEADGVVEVPGGVALDVAAAVMLQGMTAHYLCHDTYPLAEGESCLIHAGAGGVGNLLIQMAKARGAIVFATVGSPEKATVANAAGADYVIRYEDFEDAIGEIAGPRPLEVIYDGVGAATFERGLGLLKSRGTMVTFGNASGPPPPLDLLELGRNGSLFVTRPTLRDYVASREQLERRSGDLFRDIAAGDLEVRIGARFSMPEAAAAHRALESRATTGKVLLEA